MHKNVGSDYKKGVGGLNIATARKIENYIR